MTVTRHGATRSPLSVHHSAGLHCPTCALQFAERVLDMAERPSCPDCSAKRQDKWQAQLAQWKITPIADVPALATAWANAADPRQVPVAGHVLRRFRCTNGHHPRITPLSFLQNGCPSCRGNATRSARLQAVAADPTVHTMNREIASQWDHAKNSLLTLENISPGSRRAIWWKSWDCGHEWQATPAEREKGQRLRCPQCRTILDSLGYHFPELADEWSPENPLSAWHVRPSGQTAFTPACVCSNNPDHIWSATPSSRASGSGCPECREAGKSRIELAHHAAAVRVFGAAASGQSVTDNAFTRSPIWLVDITAATSSGLQVAVEYDGAYWHQDKARIDTAKSLDLLAAGRLVVRLREHPLPPLGIRHPHYLEMTVHSTAPDPDGVLDRVHDWANQFVQ